MKFLLFEVCIYTLFYCALSILSYFLAPKIKSNQKDKVKDQHLYYSYYPGFVHVLTSISLGIIKIFCEGISTGEQSSTLSMTIAAVIINSIH